MSQTLWMAPKPAKDFSLEIFPLAARYLTTDIEGYYQDSLDQVFEGT